MLADCTTSLCSNPIFKEKVGCLEIPCAICSLGKRRLNSLEGGSGKDGVMSEEATGWKCKSILTVILRKLFYFPKSILSYISSRIIISSWRVQHEGWMNSCKFTSHKELSALKIINRH